ncbi:hypothetical protein EIP91_004754 [Steccherinum ochraceum]|uniref:DUF4139 domain-containing protein n=1 Tax=Steccherinum ochraceum TaxID=92696 RepID=A0A4R0RNL4_9APHY|nr:hypothetical protein EIP91_004754 [Steccherinum ochraceum]
MATHHNVDAAELAIQSVTVFKSDRAQIVRVFSLGLKDGENIVVVNNLPNSLDPNSIRVSGLGGSSTLADVVCNIPTRNPAANDAQFALGQRKQALLEEKLIRSQEASILFAYGNSLSHDKIAPSEVSTILGTFREERRKGSEAVRALEDQLRALDEEQASSVDANKKGFAKTKVTITLIAVRECTVSLRMTYLVSRAKWYATYDLHASSTDIDTVSLQYRARITQFTGENWANTQLTLSTSDAQSHQIPSLGVYKISKPSSLFKFPAPAYPPQRGGLFGGGGSPRIQPFPARMPAASVFGSSPGDIGGNASGGLFGQSNTAGVVSGAPPAPGQTPGPLFGFGSVPFGASTTAHQPNSVFGSGQGMPSPSTPAAFAALKGNGAQTSGAIRRALATPITPTSFVQQPLLPAPADTTMDDYDVVNVTEADPDVQALMAEGTMSVKSTTLSTSFTVEGKATIQSDGASHTVPIASFTCSSTIKRISVPRLSSSVYLQCRVENATEYQLLPGTVGVFLDEEYVSKTAIKDTVLDGTFECALGVDPALRVVYERDTAEKPIMETTRPFGDTAKAITRCSARTTVQNKSSTVVKNLVVRDSLPIPGGADDEKDLFKVQLRKPEGLVEASADELVDVRNEVGSSEVDKKKLAGVKRKIRWSKGDNGKGGEEEGKYEWVVDVLPGEEVSLIAEWDIKAPNSVKWEEVLS